jgi:hypothetical protein
MVKVKQMKGKITGKQRAARVRNIKVARAAKKKGGGKWDSKFKMKRASRWSGEAVAVATPAKIKGREGHFKKVLKSAGYHHSVGKSVLKGFKKGIIKRVKFGTHGTLAVSAFKSGGSIRRGPSSPSLKGVTKEINAMIKRGY